MTMTIKDMLGKVQDLGQQVKNLPKQVSVSITPDTNGMIDKQCPRNECGLYFKVNLDDWKSVLKDEKVFCPNCGKSDEAKCFHPEEQNAAVAELVRRSILDYWDDGTPVPYTTDNAVVELASKPKLEPQIQCGKCDVRYAVNGVAHFCPNCGEGTAS